MILLKRVDSTLGRGSLKIRLFSNDEPILFDSSNILKRLNLY